MDMTLVPVVLQFEDRSGPAETTLSGEYCTEPAVPPPILGLYLLLPLRSMSSLNIINYRIGIYSDQVVDAEL